MAFPTTSVLDSFTGANEDPLATGWSNNLTTLDDRGLARISSALTNASGTGTTDTSSWYNGATYGPDCEAYITITTASAVNGDQYKLFARIVNPGTTSVSGYELHVQKDAGPDIWRLRRRDSVTAFQLGSDMNQEIASGDSIGLECIGSTISAYYKAAAGSWTLVGSRTDGTYGAAGYLAIKTAQSVSLAWTADNFGGGTIAAAVGPITFRQIGPRQRY